MSVAALQTDAHVRSVIMTRHDASQQHMQLSVEAVEMILTHKHHIPDLAVQGSSHGEFFTLRSSEVPGECC